jgi:hypothetical protein
MSTPNDKRQEIIEAYLTISFSTRTRPTYADFLEHSITRDAIRTRFGGIEKLHQYMDEHRPDDMSGMFLTLERAFSEDRSVERSKKTTYVITTAVADSAPHQGFLAALDTYSARHDAQIVIMPCESTSNSFENKTAVFASVFNDPKYMFVSKDTPLNNNISLCSIQVSAKQIRPITGLSRIGNREGSFVFASTKQFLEFVPSGNKRGTNYSIMTTGACTLPQYYTDTFVSKRLSYIAERDHTIGAIIVEIENDDIFHFRQVQADEDGSFIDLGIQYNSDGTTEVVPTNVVLGDIHGINMDGTAFLALSKIVGSMNINRVFLHDVFDGYSVNHHVTTIAEKALRFRSDQSSLVYELRKTSEIIQLIDDCMKPSEVVIVKSNHDEFLTRYLQEGRYISDPTNHHVSLLIARALFEDVDVLKHGFEVVGSPAADHWTFLDRSSSYKIGGVECGSHGDLGLNGSKPSLVTLEKVYGNCVTGHAHSAAIHRGVFRVGTMSKLDLGYNRGPTSWTHTSCLVYENGQRQLINVISGNCTTRIPHEPV